MSRRVRGTVVRFENDRGFGFVSPDDGSTDCLVRWPEIRGRGFRTLVAGERVEFEPAEEPDGRKALDVRRLDAPS